jgi:hypothetical protein
MPGANELSTVEWQNAHCDGNFRGLPAAPCGRRTTTAGAHGFRARAFGAPDSEWTYATKPATAATGRTRRTGSSGAAEPRDWDWDADAAGMSIGACELRERSPRDCTNSYRCGMLALPGPRGVTPVVMGPPTISATSLVSGSINRIRSGKPAQTTAPNMCRVGATAVMGERLCRAWQAVAQARMWLSRGCRRGVGVASTGLSELGESGWPPTACWTSAARERALFNRIGPNRQDRHLRKP